MHCEPNMKESTYEAPSINHLRSWTWLESASRTRRFGMAWERVCEFRLPKTANKSNYEIALLHSVDHILTMWQGFCLARLRNLGFPCSFQTHKTQPKGHVGSLSLKIYVLRCFITDLFETNALVYDNGGKIMVTEYTIYDDDSTIDNR